MLSPVAGQHRHSTAQHGHVRVSLTAHEDFVNRDKCEVAFHYSLSVEWHLVALHVLQPGLVCAAILEEAHNVVWLRCTCTHTYQVSVSVCGSISGCWRDVLLEGQALGC